MQSDARTPAEYLASLPADRQAVVKRLRAALKKHLPKGFEERMDYGMLAYVVPQKLYPPGYHCSPEKPLPFINLASQKRHVALYHMGLYSGPLADWFSAEWPKHTAARLDMGKCCVRLTKLDQVPYELIGQLAGKLTPQQWIEAYESAVKGSKSAPSKEKPAAE